MLPFTGESHLVKATEVTAGLAVSNGSLMPVYGVIHFTSPAGCTPGSAPGPTLGNEYGKTLPLLNSQGMKKLCYAIQSTKIKLD